jgi:hypothetical protein
LFELLRQYFFLLIARGQREKSNAVDLFVKAVTTNRSFISISIRLKSLFKAHFVSVEHQKLKREEAKNNPKTIQYENIFYHLYLGLLL